MENPFQQRKARKAPKATRLLEIDAWIDSTLYEGGFKAGEIWENLTIFFRRFRVTGWRRAIIELLSEGATMDDMKGPAEKERHGIREWLGYA